MDTLTAIAQMKADPNDSKMSLYSKLRQAINLARGEAGYAPVAPIMTELPDVSKVPELTQVPLDWSEPCEAGELCRNTRRGRPLSAWNAWKYKNLRVIACCEECAKIAWVRPRV